MIKVITYLIITIVILGALAAFLIKSLDPIIQQYASEAGAEVASRPAGKIVSVTLLEGSWYGNTSQVKTTEGSYFVVGLPSYQDGCSVRVSKRLNNQRALCICSEKREQCYWIY